MYVVDLSTPWQPRNARNAGNLKSQESPRIVCEISRWVIVQKRQSLSTPAEVCFYKLHLGVLSDCRFSACLCSDRL